MNRKVIWLLAIAVVVVGLVLYYGNKVDEDILDDRPDKVEDIKDKTENMGKDLKETGEKLFKNGNFVGRSDVDDHGSYGYIELEIKDSKIKEASYTEYQAENEQKPKDESYPYPLALDAMRQLEDKLLEVQDPDEVDDIAGATGTSDKFRVAAKRALERAQ
ncbi:MAG: FMN-binding protein [Firmicutes bacterium]|nr:FMN-binding protein [Bacillota bacterium]MDD4263633.1 FMN-binding protein [Bacillota bacterium]MDD4692989.1 FMN-binding protein [Bacillota bacterium]